MTTYLQKYPKSEHKETINNLLVSSYVTAKDYVGALKLLQKKHDSKSKEVLQKVAFYRALQLFNEANYNEAINLFNTSLKTDIKY